ncbi:hypothetical protein CDAR_52771 [Caerostris darwini]|uniref:Uncharacterized protein n=1 Tax=Caerostris darwini TaxID=1538125 RepID=A0AAV4T5F8_9ARAC|nr:hypothetical protein CDAR_52771 [Caerostris darwini]
MLREEKSYRFHLVEHDLEQQIFFLEWLLKQEEANNAFIAYISLTDEGCFLRGRVFSSYNSYMRVVSNPPAVYKHTGLIGSWNNRSQNFFVM